MINSHRDFLPFSLETNENAEEEQCSPRIIRIRLLIEEAAGI